MWWWGSFYDWIQNRRIDEINEDTRALHRRSTGKLAELEKRILSLERETEALRSVLRDQLGVTNETLDYALAHAAGESALIGRCEGCNRVVATRDGKCFYCGGRVVAEEHE